MHIVGTCCFQSFESAVKYYREYGLNAKDVARKIAEGEIGIGKPEVLANETLFVREGRWHKQVGY